MFDWNRLLKEQSVHINDLPHKTFVHVKTLRSGISTFEKKHDSNGRIR